MKVLQVFVKNWSVLVCAALASLFAACATTGSTQVAKTGTGGEIHQQPDVVRFRPGDKIVIEFMDVPNTMPAQWDQVVREDGNITLPLNKTIEARGKEKGELEQAIHKIYVPNLFKRMTVNVKPEERWYWVSGEVRNPNQLRYTGPITATQAVAAAGDYTDFADRTDIQITRASGEKVLVNGKKALKKPEFDAPVYPGDKIVVGRRF